jgi:predicted methyltransferase
MSSASSKASSVASSVSSSLSKAIPSATAAAYETASGKSETSTQTIIFTTIAITTTTILLILAGIYYSGYADDILEAAAKKYYSAKAQAEATALAHTGSEKVQGVLKGKSVPTFWRYLQAFASVQASDTRAHGSHVQTRSRGILSWAKTSWSKSVVVLGRKQLLRVLEV